MRRLIPAWVVLGLSLATIHAHADYGWVPEYQKLSVRTGADFFSTDQNYNPTGALEPLTGSGGKLHEYKLWLEGEYGIAQDWSMRLRFGYANSAIDALQTGETL